VYNIKKAVSRLEFAPKLEEIIFTDIKSGKGNFSLKADKPLSFAALKASVKKAGYTLTAATITVSGVLSREGSAWWIVSEPSKQRFALEGANLNTILAGAEAESRFELSGNWRTVGEGAAHREVIEVQSGQKLARAFTTPQTPELRVAGYRASLGDDNAEADLFLTPIRTTSPGLAVYKGGAIVPRYSFTSAHLGNLKAERHTLRLNFSYTPTQTLQLEADVPYSWSSFKNGSRTGSNHGLGNITLWGKYRFFRTVEAWGDRQAAVRGGIELPTGNKDAPGEARLPLPAFVRQQLTPIAGGLSAHAEAAYSQAKGRIVYGANVEGVMRSERDGFRLGNEVRINTDLEYVLLPLKYRSPTNELFLILESTYVHRGKGRAGGIVVPGSGSDEFFLAPALQYIPNHRFLIEASYQIPVVRNTGSQVLRTDRNLVIGIRYLY